MHLVALWREAPQFFSDAELVAFEVAEALTRMDEDGLTDDAYARALDQFGEEALAHLFAQILTINNWNRIARATAKVAGTDERKSR